MRRDPAHQRFGRLSLAGVLCACLVMGMGACDVSVHLNNPILEAWLDWMFNGNDPDQSDQDGGGQPGNADDDQDEEEEFPEFNRLGEWTNDDTAPIDPGRGAMVAAGRDWPVEYARVIPDPASGVVAVEVVLTEGAARFILPMNEWMLDDEGGPVNIQWDRDEDPFDAAPRSLPPPLGETREGMIFQNRLYRLIPVQTNFRVQPHKAGPRLIARLDIHAIRVGSSDPGGLISFQLDAAIPLTEPRP